jgi:hypothetical protein
VQSPAAAGAAVAAAVAVGALVTLTATALSTSTSAAAVTVIAAVVTTLTVVLTVVLALSRYPSLTGIGNLLMQLSLIRTSHSHVDPTPVTIKVHLQNSTFPRLCWHQSYQPIHLQFSTLFSFTSQAKNTTVIYTVHPFGLS